LSNEAGWEGRMYPEQWVPIRWRLRGEEGGRESEINEQLLIG
jgi:hypothetical protein